MESRRILSRWAVLTAALGAGAVIAGAFVPWLETGGLNMGGGERQFSTMLGADIPVGLASAIVGGVIVLIALLALLAPRGARAFGVTFVIGGLAAAAAAVYAFVAPVDIYVDYVAGELGVGSESLDDLPELFDAGLLSSDAQLGIYLTIVGAIVLIGAGIAALSARREVPIAAKQPLIDKSNPVERQRLVPAEPR